MVLVTTAINNPSKLDDDILLLGAWCDKDSLEKKHHKLVNMTANYHWSNRDKFFNDHITIINLYEKLLPQYAESLNILHNVSYSKSSWQIIIGPWLMFFISALFDRRSSINKAIEEEAFDYVALSETQKEKLIPIDMGDYYKKSGEDIWNNYIFTEIIENWTVLKFKKFPLINIVKKTNFTSFKSIIKELISKFYNKLSYFSLNNKVIFVDSYMPIFWQWRLEKLLKQRPSKFFFCTKSNLNDKIIDRNNMQIKYKPQNDLEAFIISIVPFQMPQTYIEKFESLLINSRSNMYPNSPKIIFTANAHFFNDQFKVWSAFHKEKGAKLIFSQHGGGLGSMKVVLSEYLEKSMADIYISWGWSDVNFSNIKQLPAVKLFKKRKHRPKKGLLHVMDDNSRYARAIATTPISSLHLDYLKDQFNFSNLISHELISNYVVRKSPNNYNWNKLEDWNPNVIFDSNKHFFKSMYEFKLIVITSNSTTLLQVLSANLPTVIFWNIKYNELRDDAQIDFDNLRNVGILFDSSEEAAKHINLTWNNISAWWEAKELQRVRLDFCNKYALTSNDSLFEWKSYLQECIVDNNI